MGMLCCSAQDLGQKDAESARTSQLSGASHSPLLGVVRPARLITTSLLASPLSSLTMPCKVTRHANDVISLAR